MSSLPNTHDVLLRNAELLSGQVALLGVSDAAVMPRLPVSGLVMSEQAGVFGALEQQADGWQVLYGYDCPGSLAGRFDTVVVFLPKSRAEMALRLAMARFLGSAGARILVIGGKKEGMGGAARQFRDVASDVAKVDSARHCQVLSGTNREPLADFDLAGWLNWTRLEYAGVSVDIAGLPGVFSEGELDEGTALLLDTLAKYPLKASSVLDFACGAGVIGAWLQGQGNATGGPLQRVDGVDVQSQAVFCARATYKQNSCQGQIFASDGLSGIEGRWPAVVTNPPFHSGVKTDTSMTETFLAGVSAHLEAGGELRLVANTFLPYRSLIERYLGPAEVVAQDRRFTVYRAFRRKA